MSDTDDIDKRVNRVVDPLVGDIDADEPTVSDHPPVWDELFRAFAYNLFVEMERDTDE